MNLIHDQEIDEAEKDAVVQEAMNPDYGGCFFLESHKDPHENIHDVESYSRKQPDQ